MRLEASHVDLHRRDLGGSIFSDEENTGARVTADSDAVQDRLGFAGDVGMGGDAVSVAQDVRTRDQLIQCDASKAIAEGNKATLAGAGAVIVGAEGVGVQSAAGAHHV